MVGLVQNMFWAFVFLGQSNAQFLKPKINNTRISQGTLAGLTSCGVTPTTSLSTLVERCTIGSFLFLLW